MKCKTRIWKGFNDYSCPNKALPESEYCGTHCPDRAARRKQKRGPNQFERDWAAKKEQEAQIAKLRELNKLLADALQISFDYRFMPHLEFEDKYGNCMDNEQLREYLTKTLDAAKEGV